MNIGRALYQILNQHPGFTALGAGLSPLVGGQTLNLPYVVYEVASVQPIQHRTAKDEVATITVDFTVFSERYDQAQDILDSLYDCLHYYCGNTTDINIHQSRFSGQNDSFNGQGMVYGITATYTILAGKRTPALLNVDFVTNGLLKAFLQQNQLLSAAFATTGNGLAGLLVTKQLQLHATMSGTMQPALSVLGAFSVAYTTAGGIASALRVDKNFAVGYTTNGTFAAAVQRYMQLQAAPQVTGGFVGGLVAAAPAPAFLLDTYTAALAFTLRQLKTGQGDIARVRRSSDSAADNFSAAEIEDGTLTTYTGAGGGFIEKLMCAAGSGREVLQNTASLQMRIVNAGILETQNGKPALQSVANNKLENAISSLNLNNTSGFMIFIVNRPTVVTGNRRFLSMNSTNGGNDYQAGGVVFSYPEVRVNGSLIGTAAVTNSLHSVNKLICVPGGNTYSTQNATTLNTATTPTFNINLINMAIINELSYNRSYFQGKLQEVLIFNYYNATDMAAIEDNIKTHYGITY